MLFLSAQSVLVRSYFRREARDDADQIQVCSIRKCEQSVNRNNSPVPPVLPVPLTNPMPNQMMILFLTRLKPRSASCMPKAFCRSGRSPFSSHHLLEHPDNSFAPAIASCSTTQHSARKSASASRTRRGQGHRFPRPGWFPSRRSQERLSLFIRTNKWVPERCDESLFLSAHLVS